MKRVGQALLIFVGLEVVALQVMAQRGWLVMNWSVIGRDISPQHVWRNESERFMNTLKFRLPFASAFSAGFYAGFRWT
jgi:uncharacterized membrane protein (Fun14 family)